MQWMELVNKVLTYWCSYFFLLTLNYDARNHELKKMVNILVLLLLFADGN